MAFMWKDAQSAAGVPRLIAVWPFSSYHMVLNCIVLFQHLVCSVNICIKLKNTSRKLRQIASGHLNMKISLS